MPVQQCQRGTGGEIAEDSIREIVPVQQCQRGILSEIEEESDRSDRVCGWCSFTRSVVQDDWKPPQRAMMQVPLSICRLHTHITCTCCYDEIQDQDFSCSFSDSLCLYDAGPSLSMLQHGGTVFTVWCSMVALYSLCGAAWWHCIHCVVQHGGTVFTVWCSMAATGR